MIMLITHVSILLRWDVKWFNFCQPTLLDQQFRQFDPSLKLQNEKECKIWSQMSYYVILNVSWELNDSLRVWT